MKIKTTVAPLYQLISKPLVLACCGLMVPAAHAQMLEEIMVTAQKREQNLQEVPVAVSAFTGDKLEQAGIKDMFDLQTNAPSLNIKQSQSASSVAFGIRGVFTSSQNHGLESSVGLYVDGVYRARQGSMVNNLVDVAAIEVLRGPQGTLFGRNTPAGAILVSSKKPDFEGTGFIEASVGKYDLVSVSGAKSSTAIDNVLAFRATGFITERNGYIDAINIKDEAINDRNRWGLRLQSLYTPNDDLSVHVTVDHSEIDEICCGAGTYKNNFVAEDWQLNSPAPIGSDALIVALGGTVLEAGDYYDYRVGTSFLPQSSNEDGGISVQIDWDNDTVLVSSVTSYRYYQSEDNIDADFSDVDGVSRFVNVEQDVFSQELRIAGDGDRLSYVAGVYYFQQTLDASSQLIVGEDFTVLTGAFGDAFPAGSSSLDVAEQDNKSYAIFGQFDYSVTDKLLLTAGLRWTKEKKNLQNRFTDDASATLDYFSPAWGFWLFPPMAPRADIDESIDDEKVTGTMKLTWFASEQTMFYASYGTGYKSGGVNNDRIPETVPVIFDAETSASYELGMKSEFPDQALRLNIALHKTDTNDLQTVSFNGDSFALQNAGVAETYGLELEVNWQAAAATTLSLGYAYNHAEYKDFKPGDCRITNPWHTGLPDPGQGADGICDRSGGMVSGNPENSLVLSGNQKFTLSDNISGFVYGEYSFTDDRMTGINNDPLKLSESAYVVNLRAGLILEDYDMTVTFWGRNVLNEKYTVAIGDTVAQLGKLTAYYVEPATWGITAKKHF